MSIKSQGTKTIPSDLRRIAGRHRHLKRHVIRFKKITGLYPELIGSPDGKHKTDYPNVIYPVGESIFCHIYGSPNQDSRYYAVEPVITKGEKETFNEVKRKILDRSINVQAPETSSEFDDRIEQLLSETTIISDDIPAGNILSKLWRAIKYLLGNRVVTIDREQYNKFRYRLNRDIIGLGPLEPVMRDKAIEDIHVTSPQEVFVEHDVFGLNKTNIEFNDREEYDRYLRSTAERIGNPVSDSNPIVDATLPDGSRLNLVYSDDVSLKGPSLTVRQQDETPLTITQLVKWGTFSAKAAAYMWLALENDMSAFVVGETASGKTTSLNALLSFIPRDSKIYTAEDTAEVVPPHEAWQQLLTRESDNKEDNGSGQVRMFDLIKTALRSRPDYIIVGEVRGEEGRMAFQAMQTGHPVMCTFHASDVKSMVQRFTSDPINVPIAFFGNLNIAIFQNFIRRGDQDLRRVTSIHEIEGYSQDMGGVVTREIFEWDPIKDEIIFKGMNNSYILENKIAPKLAYEDSRRVYVDLELRARVIEAMVREAIFEYHEVNKTLSNFEKNGLEGLPFDVKKPEAMLR
ncbi:type II/IV secretion system ATPase subunit [Methanonatronarchaeum sp. AMET6-2]|uniref:type II/IV secretion system ATPase subunit n=1 Tax=Methanonatronarchaeum sp. AMET6-2 TaxID=2933293 RepID=UPI001FF37130|nr:type II/IV secretion system ATPase subunit [Methanonatronarchaeum sp. AMET6-2]UOY10033.1 type II/IV secretion system ATPase subunit [Methanonatronarchaeum sp. AMET6-2]